MPSTSASNIHPSNISRLRRHPIASYFVLTFAISWIAAFLVAAPRLLHGEGLTKLTGILMFPAMLLGPATVGILLTGVIDGREGLRDLRERAKQFQLPLRWYSCLLIPPAAVLIALLSLKYLVSSAYSPNRFFVGAFFGIAAGIFEEIGWTGYAFPKMSRWTSPFRAAVLLGLLWSAWHIPVVDFLGAAVPHGKAWWPFFLAFTAAMTAIRVLICWLHLNTSSLPIAQLLHISSTGALVVFSPPSVSPMQEAFWYAVYAGALWIVVLALVTRSANFMHPPPANGAD